MTAGLLVLGAVGLVVVLLAWFRRRDRRENERKNPWVKRKGGPDAN